MSCACEGVCRSSMLWRLALDSGVNARDRCINGVGLEDVPTASKCTDSIFVPVGMTLSLDFDMPCCLGML